MLVVGAGPGPMEVAPTQLFRRKKDIQGWFSGIATDSEDTLRFSVMVGVRAIDEEYRLEKVNEAYTRMMSGKAECRVALTMWAGAVRVWSLIDARFALPAGVVD